MEGTKAVHIRMEDQEMVQEVWLAHIQDQCIIGLDLLAHWGAQIDVSRARLTIGAETIVLHTGLGGRARQNCQTVAAPPSTAAARGSATAAAGGSSPPGGPRRQPPEAIDTDQYAR